MKKFLVQIIIVVLILLTSCDYCEGKLMIINETNRPLFCDRSRVDSIEGRSIYKPFKEISDNDTLWIQNEYFIAPGSETRLFVCNTTWERKINDPYYYDGKIYIFIFDADTLQKYDWEDVKKNNRYFKKYRFTVEDLQKVDWKVRVTE